MLYQLTKLLLAANTVWFTHILALNTVTFYTKLTNKAVVTTHCTQFTVIPAFRPKKLFFV